MEYSTVPDDSLSTASRAPIVRPDGSPNSRSNSLISRLCGGTFTQRKTILLALALLIAVVFAIVGGVLGRSIASRRKISKPEMSICSSSSRLVIADDNSTGTLRGVRACGRRAWDSHESQSHLVYLPEKENCLLQEDSAELHIPFNTHMVISELGNISQARSSTLKFVTNNIETGEENIGIKIDIENSISLAELSSLTFILSAELNSKTPKMTPVRDSWLVVVLNPISVFGPSTITVLEPRRKWFETSSEYYAGLESCPDIHIFGIVTIEGSLKISNEDCSEEPTSSLQLDSSTLEQTLARGFNIAGNLKITKGAVLRLEGALCYSASKRLFDSPKEDDFDWTDIAANITLEGEEVFVRPGQPYHTEAGIIECPG